MDADPIQCADCQAHFALSPGMATDGVACPECGGRRLFRNQPSPTQSDGTLRDMVDSDSQKDQGGNPLGEGTIVGRDGEQPAFKRDNFMHSHQAGASGFMDEATDIPPDMLLRDYNQTRQQTKCPGCGLGHTQMQNQSPYCSRCLHAHPEQALQASPQISTASVTEPVEPMRSRTLDMEPYDFLFHERTAGPLALLAPEVIGEGAALLGGGEAAGAAAAAGGAEAAGAGAAGGEAAAAGGLASKAKMFLAGGGAGNLMKGALQQGGKQLENSLMGGPQSGGMGPAPVTPAPSMMQYGSVDLPMLLLADLETSDSVKSVDEQHDDPEEQDQKEFNDGDDSPKNLENPNLEDSGASGEDAVREHAGFGPDSPGIDRAMMILPLLLHYFQSEESGENDPLIKALHDTLEQENPGYLQQSHPDGDNGVHMLIQEHKKPHGVHAGVNTIPMGAGQGIPGLTGMPDAGGGVPGQQGMGQGRCPSCGGTLAGDGSCPQCGAKLNPQGGALGPGTAAPGGAPSMPPMLGGANAGPGGPPPGAGGPPPGMGGPPMPMPGPPPTPTTHQGPMTPEQIAAVQQMLIKHHRVEEVPNVPIHPEQYAKELSEIQQNPNVAPQIDPSQVPPPTPPPAMENAPGAMPMPDPSQPGGGMDQSMQPMSRVATQDLDWSCPHCGYSHFHEGQEFKDGAPGDTTRYCANCGQRDPSSAHIPYPGQIHGEGGAPTIGQGAPFIQPDSLPNLGPAHQGKTADANNAVKRCPKCKSATTSVLGLGDNTGDGSYGDHGRCHACGNIFRLDTVSSVVLADVPNPTTLDAAEQHGPEDLQNTQDSSLTWKDNAGQQLMAGKIYELHSPAYTIPDIVRVTYVHPDELGLQLVGQFANMPQGPTGEADIKVSRQEAQLDKYTFVPSQQDQGLDADAENEPPAGTPGMEHIPEGGQTTDEHDNSFPNTSVSNVVAAVTASDQDEFEPDEDLCVKCGNVHIEHSMSSPTTVMHDCFRCGHAWETKDEYQGREGSVDLSWIMHGDDDDDFFGNMDRARAMRDADRGTSSRNLSSIAAGDERLQRIKDTLAANAQQRTAGRHFSPKEQRELINERGSARNLDDLELGGTHYESKWDPTGKANGANVPDEHLVMGL